MLTHRNLVANALHKTIACGLRAEDVFLAAAPFFHVAGTAPVLSLIWLGGSLVVLPSFEAAACLDMIERYGVTVAMPVPTMLAALVEEQSRRPRDTSSLRLIGHAGSPITTPLIRRAHEVFPHVELAQYYGATETAAIVTCLSHEERHLDGGRLGSCGQPVVGVAVDVLDAAGRPCAPGDAGEIVVRGPNVTCGYWEDEAATAAAFVDGWYRMGDIGYVDEDRYLWLLDRSTDMIVTGGENVSSIEVEEVLSRHPRVVECAVFGVPDERWVQAVHAVVVVDATELATPAPRRRAAPALPCLDRRVQGAQAHRAAHRSAPQVGARQGAEAPPARGLPRGRVRLAGRARIGRLAYRLGSVTIGRLAYRLGSVTIGRLAYRLGSSSPSRPPCSEWMLCRSARRSACRSSG